MKKLLYFFYSTFCLGFLFLIISMDVSAADADYKYSKSRHYYIYCSNVRVEFDTDVIVAYYVAPKNSIYDERIENPNLNIAIDSGSSTYWSFFNKSLVNYSYLMLNSDGEWVPFSMAMPTSFYTSKLIETNVPIFDTEKEAINYINSGGDPIVETEENIYFKDFQYSGSSLLHCSWSDVYYNPLTLGIPDLEQSYFTVEITSLTPGAGTDPAIFADYGGNYNLFSVKEWNLPLSLITLDDNDATVFCAKFTPHLVTSSGNCYFGNTVTVRFNKAGAIDVVIPDINRETVYDSSCNFVGMNYSATSKDHTGVGTEDVNNVNILWNSISHTYDVSSFTNPKITITSASGKSVDLNNFVYGGNIDYKKGNGYFELNKLNCISMLFDSPPSSSNTCVWYINLTPTYTDGYNNYYGNPFVIKMENYTAVTGGIATPDDPLTPVEEVPPRDWIDPDPTPPIDITDFDFSYFTDLLGSLKDSIGGVPSFVGYCFSFLPAPVIAALAFLIIVCVILRILGR